MWSGKEGFEAGLSRDGCVWFSAATVESTCFLRSVVFLESLDSPFWMEERLASWVKVAAFKSARRVELARVTLSRSWTSSDKRPLRRRPAW